MAMVINSALHTDNHVMESFVRCLFVNSFLLKGNQGAKSKSMLGRINPSHIIEGTDETAQRDEYFII